MTSKSLKIEGIYTFRISISGKLLLRNEQERILIRIKKFSKIYFDFHYFKNSRAFLDFEVSEKSIITRKPLLNV